MKAYQPLVEKYSRQADYYDRRWNLRWGEATLRAALDAVPWDNLSRVLDVGCGTGALELAAGARMQGRSQARPMQLVGVDIALSMLQLARLKLNGSATPPARVAWANSPAEQMPFATGSFDGLVCNNSFHYYQSPQAVLAEFHRVLRPGGTLVLADWCSDFITPQLGYWALRLAHHTRIHRYALSRVYGSKEMQALLAQAGFRVASVERIGMEWGWGIMVLTAHA